MAADADREAGNAALGDGDFARAVEIYSRALEASPEDERLFSNRSLAHYRLEDFAAAIRDADEVIRLKPTWERGYVRKALAMEKAGASEQEVLAVYEEGSLRVPHSMVLARAVVGLRERAILEGLPAAPSAGTDAGRSAGERANEETARVTWKEDEIARHYAERGVMYARMKIDQPDTPFLVYDEDLARDKNLIGTVSDKTQPPEFVDIDELREKLGLVQMQQQEQQEQQDQAETQEGAGPARGVESTGGFETKRKQLYRAEGDIFRQLQHAAEDSEAQAEDASGSPRKA